MSELFADRAEQQSSGHPHDLLARLYREIGISAVAAALNVMARPAPPPPSVEEDRDVPAVLRSDDIAA